MNINFENFEKPSKEIDLELLEKVDYNDMLLCVSKTLIEYRKLYKYSQKEIANLLNVSQVVISRIENANQNLSIKTLVKIWNKLSNKDYNFAKKLLYKMLDKSKENFDLKYNYDIYNYKITSSLEEENNNVLKFPESVAKLQKYNSKINCCNKEKYENVI